MKWLAGWLLAWCLPALALDYGLAARALAPGVWFVEGANADFAPANGCNIINTGPSRLYGEQLQALIARTTPEPVVQVLQLNLHPDYFLGHHAFADVPRLATAATREGVAREAAAYENNLYRRCGDWMKGTATLPPDRTVQPAPLRIGQRSFELVELAGHTASDLVLVDRTSGIVFAGGLVFAECIPTTPHASLGRWLQSLDRMAALGGQLVVPSHGPADRGLAGIDGTRRCLRWLGHERRDPRPGAGGVPPLGGVRHRSPAQRGAPAPGVRAARARRALKPVSPAPSACGSSTTAARA